MATPPHASPFSPDALATNRSGLLTDEQSRHWRAIAQEGRKGVRRGAYVPAALGLILLFVSGPASKAAARQAVGIGCFAIAAVIVMAANRDSLSADLDAGRIDSVEGAIARRLGRRSGRGTASHYLDVAGRPLRVGRTAYDAAPEAGIVRAYYFPRSHLVVNLERLADRPIPTGPGATAQILDSFRDALTSHDRAAMAEARALGAAVTNAIRGPAIPDPADRDDGRLEAARLIGSWSNPLITVVFDRDGSAQVSVFGRTLAGHWSIDGSGRLLTDATGKMEPADARLHGDRLTLTVDGQRVTLTRV
jgi:hypothetical protein